MKTSHLLLELGNLTRTGNDNGVDDNHADDDDKDDDNDQGDDKEDDDDDAEAVMMKNEGVRRSRGEERPRCDKR